MKIEEQVLSIEQMKHLQELGVDTSDASLAWFMSPKTNQWKIKIKDKFAHEMLRRISPERYIPTYTIGDLIEKLPKSDKGGSLLINPANNEIDYGDWVYYDGELCELENFAGFIGKSVIDSLYELICWVAENHKELIK